jgi:hypothetical protein
MATAKRNMLALNGPVAIVPVLTSRPEAKPTKAELEPRHWVLPRTATKGALGDSISSLP